MGKSNINICNDSISMSWKYMKEIVELQSAPRKFIISVPSFNVNKGGVIALYRLCHLLREMGLQAFIWPNVKPAPYNNNLFRTCYRYIRYVSRKIVGKKFITYPGFNTPVAEYSDLTDAIVVYAETIKGNPLSAKNVVRWLLHKPGFHKGVIEYGEDELTFYYQKAFNDSHAEDINNNQLRVVMVLDDVYRKTNSTKRKGKCYIVRKGKDRGDLPNLDGEIVIDNLSHEEIASIFNRVEICISYDLYTMYSVYAVMCGCISVVVPEAGLTKEKWRPEKERRYGLAYGIDDIAYAESTKERLFDEMAKLKEIEKQHVNAFVKKCINHFG